MLRIIITDYNDFYSILLRLCLLSLFVCFTELIVAWVAYVCVGRAIKIGMRPFCGRGVFVLVI